MRDAERLGAVVGLMMESPLHKRWTVDTLSRLVVPPLDLEQCIFVTDDDQVVGWGSWAFLSADTEQQFTDANYRLQASDWRVGDRLWLIDAVAPWGHGSRVATEMRARLRDQGFRGRSIKFRRSRDTGDTWRYSEAIL